MKEYEEEIELMEESVKEIREGNEREIVWMVENNKIYKEGKSEKEEEMMKKERFKVLKKGSGGEYKYNGKGKRVEYVMIEMKRRREDVRELVE